MRRARKICTRLGAALLLIATVGLVVLWARSRHSMDELIFTTRSHRLIDVSSFRGKLDLVLVKGWPNAERVRFLAASPAPVAEYPEAYPAPPYALPDTSGVGIDVKSWAGVVVERATWTVHLNADGTAHWCIPGSVDWDYWSSGPPQDSGEMLGTTVEVPYWVLCSLLVCPLVISSLLLAFSAARRWRRMRQRRCLACGYDLRASTERCPECGRPSIAPYSGRPGRCAPGKTTV